MADDFGPGWYQQSLTPPTVVEGTLKFGIVLDADHAQVMWEVSDPTTGILIGQGSRPHVRVADLGDALVWAAHRLAGAVLEGLEPF